MLNTSNMEDNMKKIIFLFCILLLVSGLQYGCSGKAGLPQGAQKTAEYHGDFDSYKNSGIVQISFYKLQDGSTVCKGFFRTTQGMMYWNLTGAVKGNQVQAGFQGRRTGHLTGTLSSDGTIVSGTFELTSSITDHGTWEGKR